ncbi:hypothetical protein IQ266_18425 [filamentous cyanobacterium LEGE 11480]|uniref:Uncharacterized protein n=1 Tax=Romeriopsis navalis LEGE 11480 TaxID=2777977 RepID=A0A928Z561_9CYAN|nr:hypothetical protein [Romeriopsis navalis]MBE9031712.1 hypothetical protein [Romeriopsis navalis LEGE 11480]
MAFDLHLKDASEKIESQEEYFLVMASKQPQLYPELSALWHHFHGSPKITPAVANTIVHELIGLLSANKADRALTKLIVRLLPLFSQAYLTQESIQCSSD